MIRIWFASSLLGAFLILPSQNTQVSDAESARRDEAVAAQREEREHEAALRDFLKDQNTSRRIQPAAEAELKARFYEFRMAIPKFRDATSQYSWVLGVKDKREKLLKEIETQTNIMLRYLAAAKMKHPPQDPLEFKDYSPTELEWEMLNSAERIAAYLDFAVQAERQDVVNVKVLEFMFKLDGELLRLKWMTSHIK